MEDTICIDTDILADLLRKKDEAVQWFKNNDNNSQLATTTINLFELYYGSYRTANPEKSLEAVNSLADNLIILTLNSESAREAGKQLARLSSAGNIIDVKDILIGSVALSSNCSLKTNNKKDFEKINGLKII